jgi:DnaJ family protein A protein 5
LFRQLDKEEEMEEEVGVKHYQAPPFGLHFACAEDVFAFYDHWKHFTTCKQFSYADLYNPKDAPNRRVKRIIEIENKKERQKERNKFNDMVRELIDKLREKDPRYKKYILIQQQEKEEKRRKLEEEKAAKRAVEAERLRQYREERAEFYR